MGRKGNKDFLESKGAFHDKDITLCHTTLSAQANAMHSFSPPFFFHAIGSHVHPHQLPKLNLCRLTDMASTQLLPLPMRQPLEGSPPMLPLGAASAALLCPIFFLVVVNNNKMVI